MEKITLLSTLLLCTALLSSCGEFASETKALGLNSKGLETLQNGANYDAEMIFETALAIPSISDKTRGLLYRNLGHAFEQGREPDSAIACYKKALTLFPQDSYEHLMADADINLLSAQPQEAIAKLEKAIHAAPKPLDAYMTLGLIYLGQYDTDLKNPQKALTYTKAAFGIAENRVTSDVLAQSYYEAGDYGAAEKMYYKLAQQYPEVPEYELDLGKSKYKLKKTEEAKQIFEQLIEKNHKMVFAVNQFQEENK